MLDTANRQAILDNIEKHGCHIIMVEADNYLPGFAYTIGLYQRFGLPEIICFGLKKELSAALLNDVCSRIQEGETLAPGRLYAEFLEDYNIQFLKVDRKRYPAYFGYGIRFYDGSVDFPALQLVWPDKQHRFPWEPSFNPDWKSLQPLLDRNGDFWFNEERNLAVFTTKLFLEGHPILYVYHNKDGDWQFHCEQYPDPTNGIIVALEEITKKDPSVNDIYHLQYGWHAWRDTPESDWQYAENIDED